MKNRIYIAAALCGLLAAASCTKDNGVGIMTKEDYEGAVENGIPTYADDYSPDVRRRLLPHRQLGFPPELEPGQRPRPLRRLL